VIVLQKRTPFAKTQVGRNQRGFSAVPLVQERKEQAHLHGFHLDVSDLVNKCYA